MGLWEANGGQQIAVCPPNMAEPYLTDAFNRPRAAHPCNRKVRCTSRSRSLDSAVLYRGYLAGIPS
jgi:hypothetical protein